MQPFLKDDKCFEAPPGVSGNKGNMVKTIGNKGAKEYKAGSTVDQSFYAYTLKKLQKKIFLRQIICYVFLTNITKIEQNRRSGKRLIY